MIGHTREEPLDGVQDDGPHGVDVGRVPLLEDFAPESIAKSLSLPLGRCILRQLANVMEDVVTEFTVLGGQMGRAGQHPRVSGSRGRRYVLGVHGRGKVIVA